MTAPTLSPTTLLPALRPATWRTHRGLSDDGFCDTVATIALSRELCATFVCGNSDVSYRGLGELDLSARQAWELAARNLITRARTPEGIRVLSRPHADGLQVAMPGAPAESWLAHPHTFTILDRHLAELLGGPVAWWWPAAGRLVAVPRADVDKQAPGEGALVEWRHGFPAAVSRHPLLATPA
ncbi:hypothetical protein EAH68_10375 [Corynebacterium hylobatis]|uniref:Uncharacterized protein n=1 Tax=Corynebacterium hylobatis TaxID=1859290 RepID=A0A3S0BGX3_9CORY|nr:hypothetical protein [Corynebacterium hylobatis]RSZ62111.1 hypothetical protein EAH68_10375 [Corynebacterium hylobatis]